MSKREIDELSERLSSAFGGSSVLEGVPTTRIPGVPLASSLSYTSEKEIRRKVHEAVGVRKGKKSVREELQAAGITKEPITVDLPIVKKEFTDEEREKITERWILNLIEKARKSHRLMTDIQLADWQMGRRLSPGDKVRYVGPSRNETTLNSFIVPRESGQSGFIKSVVDPSKKEGAIGRLIEFVPDDAVSPIDLSPGVEAERQIVILQIREFTPGYLTLERIL